MLKRHCPRPWGQIVRKIGQSQTGPLAPSGLFSKKQEMGCPQNTNLCGDLAEARDSASPEIQQGSHAEETDHREEAWHTIHHLRVLPPDEGRAEGVGSGAAGHNCSSVCLCF